MKISTQKWARFFHGERWNKIIKTHKIRIGAMALVAVLVAVGVIGLMGTGASEEDLVAVAAVETREMPREMVQEIVVDGQPIASLATLADAQAALTGVIDHYRSSDATLMHYSVAEGLEISPTREPQGDVMSVEEAVSLIVNGTKEPKTYQVVDGDCMWAISTMSGMSVEELIAANPTVDPEALKIGSTLNLFEKKPYLHLTVTEQIVKTEPIEYTLAYESTSTLYKGEVKVKSEGVPGQRKVLNEVIKENGVVVASNELTSEVLSEPKQQVMLKGTKSLSMLVGSGAFVSPMGNLEISSPYGSRGGSRHTGVDFRNPRGTPIYAVDDGVVVSACYQGSYGNLVKISHGNGIETWYAHCDSFTTKVGAAVRKGDQIAKVGTTGRSTGYHLHFEVRKNGVPTNPMNYL